MTAPSVTEPPLISGEAVVGETLSVTTGTWTGEPTGYTYQWRLGQINNQQPIEGATDSTYTLTAADVGYLSVIVSATNEAGTTETYTALVGPVTEEPEETEPEEEPEDGGESEGGEEVASGDIHASVSSPLFTDGAEVAAYVARGYGVLPPSGPPGKVVETTTASGSTVEFTTLAEDTPYFAALKVGGIWQAIRFQTGTRSTPTELITRDPNSGVLETRRGDQITVSGLSKPEVESIAEEKGGATAIAASGVAIVKYDAEAEEWGSRPEGFASVIWVSPVASAPDPEGAEDLDQIVKPEE